MDVMDIQNSDIVVCRPALAKDKEAVLELSSHIWEGGDYIPYVWDEWLADPEGLFGVAEMHGRVAGVFKLTKFQENEWYMEGLRVHPDFQGQGVASHIHHYVVDTWRRVGGGIIRLATASYNVKVHRMCEDTGFKRIAEFISYRAPADLTGEIDFRELEIDEVHKVFEFVLESPVHSLSSGLINLTWIFANPQMKHLQQAAKDKHAWWWRGGRGFISIWVDDDDGENYPGIQLIACPVNELTDLLRD
jgi:GNAT superfamily N-acetyltransferase